MAELSHPYMTIGKTIALTYMDLCQQSESESEVAQSCLTLCDPMNCSLSGSSVHGIFQARVPEWVASAFSGVGVRKHFIVLSFFGFLCTFGDYPALFLARLALRWLGSLPFQS